MQVIGTVWLDEADENKFWLAEVPALDVMSQGTSLKNALAMIKDAIESLVDSNDFTVIVQLIKDGVFAVYSKAVRTFVALLLRRQREALGLSLREAASRMGSTSPNAYAQYEKGRREPTVSVLQSLLDSVQKKTAPRPEALSWGGGVSCANRRATATFAKAKKARK